MIFGMSFYQICWFFIIYSFMGWVIEIAFHAVTLGRVENRGFLNGPVCPVYGFGMLAVLIIAYFLPVNPQTQQVNAVLVFLVGMIFTTLIELIAGWILDKLFHARWWNYSSMPLNLNGYICLAFSIIWGLSVMIAVKFVHPLIAKFSLAAIPPKFGWWILGVLYTTLFIDLGVTTATVQGLNKKLKQIDLLREALRKPSDKMSETITESTIKITNKVEKAQIQVALGKAELKDSLEDYKKQLETKYHELMAKKNFGLRRLLKAFPELIHHKYEDALLELKKYFDEHKKDK